jgi:hypothetical protein
VKMAVVLLRRHQILHLFPSAMIVFAPSRASWRGVSLGGNTIHVDPKHGYSSVTITTIMHELWHWLEEKYPALIPAMKDKRDSLTRAYSQGWKKDENNFFHDPLHIIPDPEQYIGREATFQMKGWGTVGGVITGWLPSTKSFQVKVNEHERRRTTKTGTIETLHAVITLAATSLIRQGWNITGVDIVKRVQSQWHTTAYAHTNVREWGAEMFAWWSTGRLEGEPAEFMRSVLASLK